MVPPVTSMDREWLPGVDWEWLPGVVPVAPAVAPSTPAAAPDRRGDFMWREPPPVLEEGAVLLVVVLVVHSSPEDVGKVQGRLEQGAIGTGKTKPLAVGDVEPLLTQC